MGGSVTSRDLQRSSRRCSTSEEAEEALGSLVKAHLGHWKIDSHDGGRGRPVQRFILAVDADANSRMSEGNGNCVSVDAVSAPEINGAGTVEEINALLANAGGDDEGNCPWTD